jgi:multidrug efflux pump subunit AcrA (membrane-fusion protein)
MTSGGERSPVQPAAAKRNRTALTLVVALAVVTGILGFVGGRLVRSPSQEAADASPPPKTNLTAKVEFGTLIQDVVFRGTITAGKQFTTAAQLAGVVTTISLKRGDTVAAGQVLLSVNDRPVIAVESTVPLYRDLTFGQRGTDVARLQESLTDAGYSVVDDGIYGPSTRSAVAHLYRATGYSSPSSAAGSGTDSSEPSASTAPQDSKVSKPATQKAAPGTTLLASEIVMLPRLPARVAAVGGHLGGPAADVKLTFTSTAPTVTAQVNPADAESLSTGQRVECTRTSGNAKFAGRIVSIGQPVSTSDGLQSTVLVKPVTALALRDAGTNVSVLAATRGSSIGLIVPLAAVYSDSAGQVYVNKKSDQNITKIPVTVITDAEGRAQVQSAEGRLKEGDSVVVGTP